MAGAPAGWYHAEGEPQGTFRYWDGVLWTTGPMVPHTTLADAPTYPGSTPWPVVAKEEPTVHGRVLADTGRRAGAAIIDSVVVTLFSVPAMVAMFLSVDWTGFSEGVQPEFTVNRGLIGLGVALGAIYHVMSVWLTGTTIGKRVLNLEVIRASDGGRPTPGSALLRALPLACSSLLAVALMPSTTDGRGASVATGNIGTLVQIVSLFLIVRDDTGRRSLADRCGRTHVVQRR